MRDQLPSVTRKMLDRSVRAAGPLTPTIRLYLLNIFGQDAISDLHERTQKRIALHDLISVCTEDGQVALVIDSTDCDWSRSVSCHLISAADAIHEIDRIYDDREGPTSVTVIRPSRRCEVDCFHRDLALEAYEDGHPHCITFQS